MYFECLCLCVCSGVHQCLYNLYVVSSTVCSRLIIGPRPALSPPSSSSCQLPPAMTVMLSSVIDYLINIGEMLVLVCAPSLMICACFN